MAFVRTKKIKGKEYRYLVESYRDDRGKVRQRTIKYLGAANQDEKRGTSMVTAQLRNITFEEYLSYDDGTNKRYELVDGKLVEMPPASFLGSPCKLIGLNLCSSFSILVRYYTTQYISYRIGDLGKED